MIIMIINGFQNQEFMSEKFFQKIPQIFQNISKIFQPF